jgi:hypothetical protein
MRARALKPPEIFAWAATRVVLGVGIGFLQARRLGDRARKRVGIALLSVGALSTIPLGIRLRRAAVAPA